MGAYSSRTFAAGLRYGILCLLCLLAFTLRLFAVVRYESVIHEFDPYFNYRVAIHMTQNGLYEGWNWFDHTTWYPLGRIIGGTVYPGLMWTAYSMWKFLRIVGLETDIRNVCVFTSPIFSGLTSIVAYLLTKEAKNSRAGLLAAAFVGIVPSYISRSVAGSYDNEGVAIFAMINTFYFWVKAVKTGKMTWALGSALAYAYMIVCWGGYVFVGNLIALYSAFLVLTGLFSLRLYVAYSTWYILGTLSGLLLPVVGFNAIHASENIALWGTFVLMQIAACLNWVNHILEASGKISRGTLRQILVSLVTLSLAGMLGLGILVQISGYRIPWTGRAMTLIDPTYASKYIPIIASVSEHQPSSWSTYFMDIHMTLFLMPLGIIFCFRPLTDASLFVAMYGVIVVYFSGVMIRLMLVLAPAACILSGIGLSAVMDAFGSSIKYGTWRDSALDEGSSGASESVTRAKSAPPRRKSGKSPGQESSGAVSGVGHSLLTDILYSKDKKALIPKDISVVGMICMVFLLAFYVVHACWITAEGYSSPSIVLASRQQNGASYIFDDFREGYRWMSQNTDADAKIASWWDYGYQSTAMSNRTVIVDNNTWNNTHIATVGRAMSSPERKAYNILRELDVNYVFVIFGGVLGYASDDINKFLWMVRIGGGVYPEIKERDYYTAQGRYSVGSDASPAMYKSLMYKLSYYNFDKLQTGGGAGFDRVRQTQIRPVKLFYFEEVFTSEHWLIRVYKLKDLPNRANSAKFSNAYLPVGRSTIGFSSAEDLSIDKGDDDHTLNLLQVKKSDIARALLSTKMYKSN